MKGKKGMTLVIAVGKPSPKSPMDTANAAKDEKKKGLATRGFGRDEPTTLAQVARRRNLISLQPQGADMIQRSDDPFDMAWSLLKNYNQMGVSSETSGMMDLQAARQKVLELDAAAQAEQDPQRKMELQAMANSMYQQLTQMMSARR